MIWHSQNNSWNGFVKHPCDAKAWKHIHEKFPTLASDARNVHLAFATNGVNPYKLNHSMWSTWPIILLNHNIFPWLATFFFFCDACIIHFGEKISVIKELWCILATSSGRVAIIMEGNFCLWHVEVSGLYVLALKGVLLWTMHNFLGYGTVVGVTH